MKMNKLLVLAFKHTHENQMEHFRSFNDKMEGIFISDISNLKKMYDEYTKDLDENHEYKHYIDEDFGERYSNIEHQINNIYRRSLITSIYSYLEVSLARITKRCFSISNTPYPKKNHLSIIELYKDALEKERLVDFSKVNNEWNFISDARKIRVLITHRNGMVNSIKKDNYDTDIEDIAALNIGISVRDGDLIVDSNYLTELIKCIDSFLMHTINESFSNLVFAPKN
ncbi:hypothetical protein HZI30_13300 [Serratia fonticola]|uniref:hypothetical protein n=1 Tax=Serratia fonticola TaxID=47917 RepID=UPI0015C618E7|nr:hypothetical protein [Serratia fonticola]NXZ87909.1 hypothetical protein [Serratia fonticola]